MEQGCKIIHGFLFICTKSHEPSSPRLTFPAPPDAVTSYHAQPESRSCFLVPRPAETRQEGFLAAGEHSRSRAASSAGGDGDGPRQQDHDEAMPMALGISPRQGAGGDGCGTAHLALGPHPAQSQGAASWCHPTLALPCPGAAGWHQGPEAQRWLLPCPCREAPCPASWEGQGRVGAPAESREMWNPSALGA